MKAILLKSSFYLLCVSLTLGLTDFGPDARLPRGESSALPMPLPTPSTKQKSSKDSVLKIGGAPALALFAPNLRDGDNYASVDIQLCKHGPCHLS